MYAAIDQALAMPISEQKARMTSMYQALCHYDVKQWANHVFREAKARSAGIKKQALAKVLALA